MKDSSVDWQHILLPSDSSQLRPYFSIGCPTIGLITCQTIVLTIVLTICPAICQTIVLTIGLTICPTICPINRIEGMGRHHG